MLAAGAAIASAVRGWSAPAAASLGYATMALCFDYNSVWIHVSNAQRITFDLFLMLLLASFELGRRGRLRWVMPVFWAATAVYVFWGAFDAPFIRAALPL
jgi:hypothetical protein